MKSFEKSGKNVLQQKLHIETCEAIILAWLAVLKRIGDLYFHLKLWYTLKQNLKGLLMRRIYTEVFVVLQYSITIKNKTFLSKSL